MLKKPPDTIRRIEVMLESQLKALLVLHAQALNTPLIVCVSFMHRDPRYSIKNFAVINRRNPTCAAALNEKSLKTRKIFREGHFYWVSCAAAFHLSLFGINKHSTEYRRDFEH